MMIDQLHPSTSPQHPDSTILLTLRPVRTGSGVETIHLEQGRYTLGGSRDADVVLPTGGVQPQHCRIVVEAERAVLAADSRMTWVNDAPVTEQPLSPGDRLAIGPLEFLVEISPSGRPEAGAQGADPEPGHGFDEFMNATVQGAAESEHTDATDLEPVRQTLARHEENLARTEQAVRELESRRVQLQLVLDELLAETEQVREDHSRLEQQERQRRDELGRLENELLMWQAAVADREQLCAEQDQQLQRRFSSLQEVESRINAHGADLDETAEHLAQRHRELAERETLLQSRLDDLGQAESALIEHEAELRQRSRELDQQDSEQHSNHEQLFQELREQISRMEGELDEAHRQLTEANTALSSPALVDRQAELEDLAGHLEVQRVDIEQRESDLETNVEELERAHEALTEQQEALEAEQRAVAEQQSQLEEQATAFARERSAFDAQCEEIAGRSPSAKDTEASLSAEQQRLAAEREELSLRTTELMQRLTELKHHRNDVRAQRADVSSQSMQSQQRETELASRLESLSEVETGLREYAAELADREQSLCDREASLVADEEAREPGDASTTEDAELRQQALDEIAESRAELDRQREEFGTVRATVERDRASLREDRETVDVLRRNLQDRERELEIEDTERQQQLAAFEVDNQQMKQSLEHLQSERDALQVEREQLVDEQDSLTAELETLRGQLQAFLETAESQAPRTEDATGPDRARELVVTASAEPDAEEPASEDPEPVDMFALSAEDEVDSAGDEILDDRNEAEALSLRSQMAEMFGINTEALSATGRLADAPETDDIHQPAEAEAPGTCEITLEEPPGDEVTPPRLDADDPDSIASYMRNLFARYSGGHSESAPPASCSPKSKTVPAEQSAGAATPAALDETPIDHELVHAEPSVTNARSRSNHQQDLERLHLDSFRELANLSARSALAKHTSTELKNTLLIQCVVAAACLSATIVLLGFPLRNQTGLQPWGVVTAALSVVMVWMILRTSRQMHSNKSGGSGSQSSGVSAPVVVTDVPIETPVEDHETTADVEAAAVEIAPAEENSVDTVDTPEEPAQPRSSASPPQLSYDEEIPV